MSTHFLPLISKAFTQQLKSLSSSSSALPLVKKTISAPKLVSLVGVPEEGKPAAPIKVAEKKLKKAEPKVKIKTLIENLNATSKLKQNKNKKKVKSSEIVSFVEKSVGAELSDKFGAKFIISQIPSKVLKSISTISTTSYLVDANVAGQIAQLVKQDCPNLESPVVEISPGLGLLTSEILKLGFKNVTGLEENNKLLSFLKDDRSLKVEVLPKGFPEFPRLHHVDKVDGGARVANLLHQVKVGKQKGNNLLIFGAIPSVSLINFIIRSLATGRIFYEEEFDWEDPIYYVALSSKAHWILNAQPSSGFFLYRPSSVLFQTLFKYKVLGELPRKAWIPWINDSQEGKSNKYKIRNNYNTEICYLVKIESNQEVIKRLGKDQLIYFWYFVRQHLFSRKHFVIQELEQWVPGCGARLIKKGFTIYTQFGILTPQNLLELYFEFVSWPEFSASSFGAAVEKFQARLDLQEDEVH